MRSQRTKACDIPARVKKKVWERDGGACVVCGNRQNVMPNAHFIPRSKGGLGVEQNVVTLCTGLTENNCHHHFDNGTAEERAEIREKIAAYLSGKYPGWNPDKLVFQKGQKKGAIKPMKVQLRVKSLTGNIPGMDSVERESSGYMVHCYILRCITQSEFKRTAGLEFFSEAISKSRTVTGKVYHDTSTGEYVFLPSKTGSEELARQKQLCDAYA